MRRTIRFFGLVLSLTLFPAAWASTEVPIPPTQEELDQDLARDGIQKEIPQEEVQDYENKPQDDSHNQTIFQTQSARINRTPAILGPATSEPVGDNAYLYVDFERENPGSEER